MARFHWQNLNEKKHGKMGWGLWYGRAWLHLTERTGVSLCWSAKPKLELEVFAESGGMVSGDRHVTLHACLLGLGLFVSVSAPFLARLAQWAQRRDGIRTGISLEWTERTPQLKLDFATREMSYHSRDRWWMKSKTIDFANLLFGRAQHSREVLKTCNVVIPMPEGSYPATVELDVRRWKRPRWPRALVRYGSNVEIPGGIPFMGKGENSWDCGDDGLYGTNPAAETAEDAIAATVASVLKKRRRYGETSETRGRVVLARPAVTTPSQEPPDGK